MPGETTTGGTCRTDDPEDASLGNGYRVIKTPSLNKGLGFTTAERETMGLKGLLPPAMLTLEAQVELTIQEMRRKSTPLEKYVFLQSLQDVHSTLYYAVLSRHTYEVMPFVYTPVVGEACQKFSQIYRHTPQGLYLSLQDRGQLRSILDNWPVDDIRAIVFTDGERILGLGDQGIDGMGIPIGKLALYTACAGVHPSHCLPVTLDVGTNNQAKLDDPYYIGLKHRRLTGPEYDAFVGEFMEAAVDKYGESVMLQFEDFGNNNAFRLLHHWQEKVCCFNDDIQGTAAVALAGILASTALTGIQVENHRFLFMGAGEAGAGIAELIAYAIKVETGKTIEECRKQIFMVDSKGLVCLSRLEGLQHHKRNFAHDVDHVPDLLSAVKAIRPTALIGVSTLAKSFNETIIREMSAMNKRPVIFALSNPTSKAECTPEEAYKWSNGMAVFASGSPFEPVEFNGKTYIPGQGNNAYIFPGIGLAAVACGATRITDLDMYIAAKALAEAVPEDRLEASCIYPHLEDIREVSLKVAVAVAANKYATGQASVLPKPTDLESYVRSVMYEPGY
uniref:Malic enzyme n=1 Tax=Sargassum vachellianum TaxID=1155129 RepID=A0A097IUI1_9PHAE|nr:malic enzyme [Sargassum vachellianum]